MTERVLIEGMMPYRALNRLRREGICLKNAQKVQKNQIIFTVDSKDIAPLTPIGFIASRRELSSFLSARWKPLEWLGVAASLS